MDPSQTVLIKPNFNSADPFPASSHPDHLQTLVELMREAIAEAFAEPGLEEALDALFFIGVTVLPKDQYYELIDFERKAVRLGYPKLQ